MTDRPRASVIWPQASVGCPHIVFCGSLEKILTLTLPWDNRGECLLQNMTTSFRRLAGPKMTKGKERNRHDFDGSTREMLCIKEPRSVVTV